MKRLHTMTTLALTGIVGFTAFCAPIAAQASEEGKRNTAIGLGALAAALLLTQKNKTPGLIAAGGAVIAATQIGKDHRHGYNDRYDYDHRSDRDNRFDRNRDHRDDSRDNGYRYDGRNDRNDNRDFHQGDRGDRHTAFGR